MYVCSKSQRGRRRRNAVVALFAAVGLIAAACGNDDSAATTEPAGSETTSTVATGDVAQGGVSAATTEPAGSETTSTVATGDVAQGGVDLESLVADAEDEGSLTLYTSQSIESSEALAAAFMNKYPNIDVRVIRDLDTNALPKVEAERQTGRVIADVLVAADQVWLTERDADGYFVPLETGRLDELEVDLSQYGSSENYYALNAVLFTYGWNTERTPSGIGGYEDLLAPELAGGAVGIVGPTSPSRVAYYMSLRDTYGDEYLPALLAQAPHVYESAGQLRQGLISGEVAAALFVGAGTMLEDIETGAPVDFDVPERAFGATFFGTVLEHAENPNAAQLFLDFTLTAEGQAAFSVGAASLLPDIDGALTSLDSVDTADIAELTSERVAGFQAEWESWK